MVVRTDTKQSSNFDASAPAREWWTREIMNDENSIHSEEPSILIFIEDFLKYRQNKEVLMYSYDNKNKKHEACCIEDDEVQSHVVEGLLDYENEIIGYYRFDADYFKDIASVIRFIHEVEGEYKNTPLASTGLKIKNTFENTLYRFDFNPPHIVLRNGFSPSKDFTAINNMLGDDDALIVSDNPQGVVRYRDLVIKGNKNSGFIYRINGEGVSGVSLDDNIKNNKAALKDFLEASTSLETEDDIMYDTSSAAALYEAHIDPRTIKIENISLSSNEELPPLEINDIIKKYF